MPVRARLGHGFLSVWAVLQVAAMPVQAQSSYDFVELRSAWLATSELTNPQNGKMSLGSSGIAVGSVRKITGYTPDIFSFKFVPVYALSATQWPAGSGNPTTLATPAGTISSATSGTVARAIDASGRVVGLRHINSPEGFVAPQPVLWTQGTPTVLSTQHGSAEAVHATGGVVGYRLRSAAEVPTVNGITLAGVRQAVAWRDGAHVDLHPPGVPATVSSEAVAVNGLGQIAIVTRDVLTSRPGACYLYNQGVFQVLPMPAGAGCLITGLNELGVAVGEVRPAGSDQDEGVWWPQGQMQSLPVGFLPAGINRAGLVVGRSAAGAAVWKQGAAVQALTGRVKGVPSGAQIVDVVDVNDQGRMTVAAHFPKSGGGQTLRWGVVTPLK